MSQSPLNFEFPTEVEVRGITFLGAVAGSSTRKVRLTVRTECTYAVAENINATAILEGLLESSRTQMGEGPEGEAKKAKDVQVYDMKSRNWKNTDLRLSRPSGDALVKDATVVGVVKIHVTDMKASIVVKYEGAIRAADAIPLTGMCELEGTTLVTGLQQLPLLNKHDEPAYTIPGEESDVIDAPFEDGEEEPTAPKWAETPEDIAAQAAVADAKAKRTRKADQKLGRALAARRKIDPVAEEAPVEAEEGEGVESEGYDEEGLSETHH